MAIQGAESVNPDATSSQQEASDTAGPKQGPGEPLEPSKYPTPIPAEWQAGRAAKAEEWFQRAREEAARKFKEKKQQEADAAAAAIAEHEASLNRTAQLEVFSSSRQQWRDSLCHSLRERLDETLGSAEGRQVMRFPHYTARRPLTLLYWRGADFRERLFVRGLLSTLMAHGCQPTSSSIDSGWGLASGSGGGASTHPLDSGVGQDLVWCDMLQPRLGMRDWELGRLESISGSPAVLLVLSQGYATSPEFAAERDLLVTRLTAPPAPGQPQMQLLVASFSSDPHRAAPRFPSPRLPEGHPASGTTLVHAVVVDAHQTPRQQVSSCLEGLRAGLAAAANIQFPEEEDVEVYFHPTPALARAFLSSSLPLPSAADDAATSNSLSALTTNPAAVPVDPGASWVAAQQLPHPLVLQKPMEDWSMHDVQVWIQSHGASFNRFCWSFLRLCVDGWLLLGGLSDQDLQQVLGVHSAPARQTLLHKLASVVRATARLSSTTNMLPTHADAAEIFTMTDRQLDKVFLDVFHYYDADRSGGLNEGELRQLLAAWGLQLTDKEVSTTRAEYDSDGDGVLSATEAGDLMWDLWRLLLASRDTRAWNIPSEEILGTSFDDHETASAASYVPSLPSFRLSRATSMASAANRSILAQSASGGTSMLQRSLSKQMSIMGGVGARSSRFAGPAPWAGAFSMAASRAASIHHSSEGGESKGARCGKESPDVVLQTAAAQLAAQQLAAGQHVAGAGGGGLARPALNGHAYSTNKRTTRFAEMTVAAAAESRNDEGATRSGGGRAGHADQGAATSGASHPASEKGPAPVTSRDWTHAGKVSFAAASTRGLSVLNAPHGRSHSNGLAVAAHDTHSVAATAAAGGGRMGGNAGLGAAWGQSRYDDDDDAYSVGTIGVANLEAFLEVQEGGTMRRNTADSFDLGATLSGAIATVDLKRSGQLPGAALRSVLTHGAPAGALTPVQLRLVSTLLPSDDGLNSTLRRGTGKSTTSSIAAGGEVEANRFVGQALEAVADSEAAVLEQVYSPDGLQQLLWKLHVQLRPLPTACIASEQGVVLRTDERQQEDWLVPLSSEEAHQVLAIACKRVTTKLPVLVQAAILQEAQAASDVVAGTGHEVNAWSCTVAHMLHTYDLLMRARAMRAEGMSRGAV